MVRWWWGNGWWVCRQRHRRNGEQVVGGGRQQEGGGEGQVGRCGVEGGVYKAACHAMSCPMQWCVAGKAHKM